MAFEYGLEGSFGIDLGRENSMYKKSSMNGCVLCLEKCKLSCWICLSVCGWVWLSVPVCESLRVCVCVCVRARAHACVLIAVGNEALWGSLCLGNEWDHFKTFKIELPSWCAMNGLPVFQRARYPCLWDLGISDPLPHPAPG